MRLYLVTFWPPGVRECDSSLWAGGTTQWETWMRLHLVPCTAMRTSNLVAEDRGLVEVDQMTKIHLADSSLMGKDAKHYGYAHQGVKPLKLRILLSYWYYKDTDLDELFQTYFTKPYPDVLADSGAFSAMTQGAMITVDEYADWVRQWRHLFTAYANLDVIKDAEATWRNHEAMKERGLKPVPCFHVLEDFDWLRRYVDDGYRYIALGVAGMQARRDAVMRWLVKCFKIAGDEAVFHGFALTSWKVLRSFPWYSADSSSWGAGFRYGRVPLFDADRGRFAQADLGDPVSCYENADLFRSLGFDPADFADRERNDRAKICAISALSYMQAERWLEAYHGPVPLPDGAKENIDLGAAT